MPSLANLRNFRGWLCEMTANVFFPPPQNSTRRTHPSAFHRRTTAHRKWKIMKSMLAGSSRRSGRRRQSLRAARTSVSSVKNLFRASDIWRNTSRWVWIIQLHLPLKCCELITSQLPSNKSFMFNVHDARFMKTGETSTWTHKSFEVDAKLRPPLRNSHHIFY